MVGVKIYPDTSGRKRLVAEFDDGRKTKFGSPTAFTYYDGASDEKRNGYIARHSKNNENWTSSGKHTAGFLARWILWERGRENIKRKLANKGVQLKSLRIKKNSPK